MPGDDQSLRNEWLPAALQAVDSWGHYLGSMHAMNLPLEVLLVADFSRVLAGPLAATMLADLWRYRHQGGASTGR
jgi:hypothetical protein